MPLRHEPLSLKRSTLVSIARNFNLICYSCKSPSKMIEMVNSEEYLNFESPFNDIPPHLVEELGEEVKHIMHLRRHHLHALLTPNTICWSSYGVGDIQAAIKMLPDRCKNLKKLNIPYLRHINPNILFRLVPNFTSLVCLNLRRTLIMDQMLGEIGERCPNMVDLNIMSTPITDRGMVMLCLRPDGSPRCQKLQRLVVYETSITRFGAAIVLLSLPLIREFDFDRMFEAIGIVNGWSDMEEHVLAALGVCSSRQNLASKDSLLLTTFTSTSEAPSGDLTEVIANVCPCIGTLSLDGTALSSEALYPFMVLRHLTSLSLTNYKSSQCYKGSLDFEDGVLPLLTAIGHQLKNLILSKFSSIDITAIGKACPNLINFALSEVERFESSQQAICEENFRNLLALEIWADNNIEISTNILQQLLSFSPNLKNLLFKAVRTLTDKVLLKIWKDNSMKHLSHLTIDHCHGITSSALQWLLDSENDLTVLRIWSCYRINKEVKNQIANRIESENMDVYFEWFQLEES